VFKNFYYNFEYSKKTIVRDLLLWLVLLVVFVVTIAAAGYYTYSRHTVTERINKRADTLIEELSSMLSVPLFNINIDGVAHVSRIYSQMPDLHGIRVENEQGKILFDTIAAEHGNYSRENDVYQGELYLGHVTLELSNSQYQEHIKHVLILILLLGILLILAMVVGIHVIMRYILTIPLHNFNSGLSDIAGGNYSTRLLSVQHVDLNCSVDAVNSMAGKIEKVVGELKVTRDFLQNVLNSMPSIMIGVDSKCCITNVNLTAIRSAEEKRRECKGKPIAEVFPCLKGEVTNTILQSMAKHMPITFEQRNSHIFGDTKHVEITVYPLHTSITGGAVVRVDDISSRVQLQEVMVQTEKMMSVGSLGAGMAHEINNPLGGILQATQNIERRLSPKFPKNRKIAEQCGIELQALENYLQKRKISPMLNGIREAGQRAAEVVQNMLKFSQYSDSTMESCLFSDILDRVLELAGNDYDLKRKYDFKNFKIIRNCSSDIELKCSRAEIEQVFYNLLINAAQAYKEDDLKNGLLPEITINVNGDEDFVTIEVIDNGSGIEGDVQKRIFEPFFTTKKVGEGTGLGLAVSYYIVVEQHKGVLSVESIPGQGTVVTVKLPVN
jgi:PAS domain S-box-containing protein